MTRPPATQDRDAGGAAGARMPPALRLLGKVTALLDLSGKLIAVSCLAFMFAALLVNVVLRYVMSSGIAWAYEIHAVLLPWLVAGGVVIASARGANIAITLLPGLLGPRAGQALMVVVQLLILAISLSVLISSQPILKASQFQTLSTLGIRQVWGYASLVYAFGGMAIIAAIDVLRTLRGWHGWDMDPAHGSLS
ncbi:TRAP transporter small permease [Paracoccus spongiarum]|uniref:TRAP transporter small permease protein n=1 Tax=Paracoccus spongiarum TaxID=3064387 RepID=A0ABT9JFB6_9RHOB|nr:TRAP transporter small permease subunit [Paracoccus sp. 2205BS29-5]MDP5308459.1 TRAP transporter small permease subunit [Paracoccus sp. 2205BS29-5]